MNEHLDHLPSAPSTSATGRLDSNMGHELRSPMVTIIAQVETLLAGMHGPLTGTQHAAIESIQHHAREALALVADIVDLGKLAEGHALPAGAPCDLEAVCREAVRNADDLMRSRSIKCTVQTSPAHIQVLADPTRLRRLISEFVHATVLLVPAGAEIRLFASTSSSGVRFESRPAEQQTPCSTAHATHMPDGKSDALQKLARLKPIGLALMNALVRLHDGRFTIRESAEPRARTLILDLPLPVLAEQDCNGNSGPAMPAPGGPEPVPGTEGPPSPLILLADDQPILLTVTRTYLESLGYRVEAARDGVEAVEMALRLQPDLILMDVRMPMLDGPQAVARIRASSIPNAKTVPIICASGMVNTGEKDECLAAGATAYLAKPFGIKQIDNLLVEYLHAAPAAFN